MALVCVWLWREGAIDYRFNAEEWTTISASDRARRCRLMSEEASKLAVTAKGEMKDNYLTIARDWEKLAVEIERTAKI